jgi:formylglycine-generating enzyme required for sulfatase activity
VLKDEEHAMVEVLVGKHLQKHGGDVRATLGAVADASARDAIRSLDDPDVRKSISSLPPAAGYVLVETVMPPTEEKRSRYTMTRIHAEGGLGRVWLARDTDLNREVALKEILPDKAAHPEMWRRFLKEAQVTGQLEHPNIVPVYELARRAEDDQPFYTMRFVRGRTLRQAIAEYHDRRAKGKADPLELPTLLQAFISVCQAIGYAHSRGVIHRDLKPDNVILGGFGEVLVLDWGLAKQLDRPDEEKELASLAITDEAQTDATRAGFQPGTPAYMAPEQAEGLNDLVDARTDVYGLGAILFEILTGRPPHQGQNFHELIYRIATGATPRTWSIEPSVPLALDAICARAMAKARAERYAKATDLADDVKRYLADEPVSAWAEPWSVRARRWLGRHRVAAASAAGAILVALLIGVPLVVQTIIDEREAEVRARGRVAAIVSARIEALPGLVEGVGADRARVVRLLRTQFHVRPLDPMGRLHVALALGPIDRELTDFLEARLLDDNLDTLPQVCKALQGVDLKPTVARLWKVLEADPRLVDRQFAAACALARLDPPRSSADEGRWSVRAELIVSGCIEAIAAEPSRFETVVETFRPVRRALFATLAERFRDVPIDVFDPGVMARRTIAAALLDRFADRPVELATLIQAKLLGPRLAHYLDRLRALGEPAIAALVEILSQDDPIATTDAADDPERAAGLRARRKARVAAALVALGRPGRVWELLGETGDPTLRTELIHVLPGVGTGARREIVQRIATEDDTPTRRALILSLGSFPPDSIDPEFRRFLRDRLVDWYRRDPDPGVHGASGWLLRVRWDEAAALDRIDRELAGPGPAADRGWFVNSEGQTLAIVRSFAVATREVTLAEYRRFLRDQPEPAPPLDDPEFRRLIWSDDSPVVGVSWFDAARYCNWLSRRDGIPEAQWCYPTPIREGMRLDPKLLDRSGYRLPTEIEWEHACQAGVTTSRPFGDAWDWAADYGWFSRNAGGRLHPVALKQPNDLGLFDALGNAAEWTLDRYRTSPEPGDPSRSLPDGLASEEVTNQQSRIFRGGSFLWPERPRSADRDASLPANRSPELGFRVARTCR